MLGKDLADLCRNRAHEDQFRATPLCRDGGHGRSHAEGTSLIACGGDDAARGRSADSDGLAAQLRIVALFDRGVVARELSASR